jgi:hypothetical protein
MLAVADVGQAVPDNGSRQDSLSYWCARLLQKKQDGIVPIFRVFDGKMGLSPSQRRFWDRSKHKCRKQIDRSRTRPTSRGKVAKNF